MLKSPLFEDYSITAICDYLNKNNVKTVMEKNGLLMLYVVF